MDKDQKPALGYFYVKEMLGDELFLKALHFYIGNWSGRHPTPYDFFNCVNTASGINLNWFWNNWFFEKHLPDLAIGNKGGEAIPVHITIYLADGSLQLLHSSIACWAGGSKIKYFAFNTNKIIKKIILGTAYDADVDKTNNYWEAPSPKVTGGNAH